MDYCSGGSNRIGAGMSARVEAAAKANYEAVTGTPWVSAPKLTAKLCRKAAATIIAALKGDDA